MIETDTIICGDCLEVMKDMPDNCVDLCLCDPPYGISYQSAWRTDRNDWKPKIAGDTEPFVQWIAPSFRLLVDSGRVVSFLRWDVEDVFRAAFADTDFIMKSQIIWDKVVHGMGDLAGEFAPQHESALYATKGRYVFEGARPKSVLRYIRVMPEKLQHPNEKPVPLLMELIGALTRPNDLILDPFCGSGTTCVAAKMLGRHYIGIDISEEYCAIARKRVEAAEKGISVKELEKGQKVLF